MTQHRTRHPMRGTVLLIVAAAFAITVVQQQQQQQTDHRPLPGDTVSFDPFAEDPVHASSQILALIAAGNDIATARRG